MIDERDWEAENDAETLAMAEAIKNDAERHGKAKAVSVKLAKEAKDQATAMAKIANEQMFAKSAKDMGLDTSESET